MSGMVYEGISTNKGIKVPEEEALEYALQQIQSVESEREEFLEWFYSGNWVKEREEDGF